jgi:ubiquinone/menaquinone biosynthesis C-methylase UbiE
MDHRMAASRTAQQRVDAYFRTASSYWRDIYRDAGLEGMIYQYRRRTGLAWIEALGLPAGARILEVGCGAGLTACALARAGYRVEAVDSVPEMLELTRQTALEKDVASRIGLHLGDIHALDFEDHAFHAALALGVMPWVHAPEAAVRELARVVRPGGYVLLTADNRQRLNHLLDPRLHPALEPVKRAVRPLLLRWGLRRPSTSGVPARMHTPEQFDALLASAGLEKVRSGSVGFGPFSFLGVRLLPDAAGRRVQRIFQALADRRMPGLRSTGVHYLVLARTPSE